MNLCFLYVCTLIDPPGASVANCQAKRSNLKQSALVYSYVLPDRSSRNFERLMRVRSRSRTTSPFHAFPFTRKSRFFSFSLRFFSPASHRWQKRHRTPCTQPLVDVKAHGLHSPCACLTEPALGSSDEPNSGPNCVGSDPLPCRGVLPRSGDTMLSVSAVLHADAQSSTSSPSSASWKISSSTCATNVRPLDSKKRLGGHECTDRI